MERITFCGIQLDWEEFYWGGKFKIPVWKGFQSRSGPYCSPDEDGSSVNSVNLALASLDEEPHEPHPLQQQEWNNFKKSQKELIPMILDRAFIYYKQTRPNFFSMGPEWVENMPVLSSSEQLISMIGLSIIHISWPYDDDPVLIGLEFGCDWDEEHGMGILLQENKIVKVGMADVAFA